MHGGSQRAPRRDVYHANDNEQCMTRFSNSRISSTAFTSPTSDAAQTPRFNSMKGRRLYGLNSRFDRMLQEVTWASHVPNSSFPRRKRAYSSGSSSMTNRDSPKTPTEVEYGSTKLERSFVPAMTENWLSGAMSGGKAHFGSSQVGTMGDLATAESSQKLPEWLNNVLVTLPPNHAVRCLTLPPDDPIRTSHVAWNPDSSEEGSIFTFQVPVDEHRRVNRTETEGQPMTALEPFQTAHDGSTEFRGNCPTALPTCTVPFSTPGPGRMTSQVPASYCQHPLSSALRMSRPTTTGIMDSPLPFSTPGPFVHARATYGRVLDRSPATQLHVACDTILPTAEWKVDNSFLKSRATETSRPDARIPPDQGHREQFLESFSSPPEFALDDVAGPFPSPGSIYPTVYVGATTENPSFSPMPLPASPKDKSVVTTPRRNPTWYSPTAVMRPSGVMDQTGWGKTLFLSDFQPDEKASYDSLSNLNLSQVATTGMSNPVTPPPPLFPRHLPTDFDWVSPDAHSPGVIGNIQSVDGANMD